MPDPGLFGYERIHMISHSMAVLSGSAAEGFPDFGGESDEMSRFI